MGFSNQPRPQAKRTPLADSTQRVNNASNIDTPSTTHGSFSLPHHESLKPTGKLPIPHSLSSPRLHTKTHSQHERINLTYSPGSNAANPRLSAISKEDYAPNSNRNSQISTTSTNGSDGRRRKTHIGPWHLGKTLGKGATARVRMARHAVTGQLAAIKIVQKKNAQLSQAGSLAALDQMDATSKHPADGAKRMPYGIEREVAIMKLIEHPHILKLYDIWENRTEIYLVLEYIDNGELFEHISKHGFLGEEEALKYFRQLLSAVGYCHSFNICHRDLKPENILLTKNLEVKVADFGMAALHQTPEHRLQTSCGSPHYAAPEVIKATLYRGDKADIWSMGVILYASLAGYLPFDHDDLPGLLDVIKKGRYKMPAHFSPEAADLIRRMLQLNGRDRIGISQMWRHPLLRKYNSLDDYGGGNNSISPEIWKCDHALLQKSDIDRELLRHLRSMWHTFEEQHIIDLLLSDQPNEQKLFYNLLLRHREAQLENYVPDIGHSTSDYHHTRPLAQIRKLSTRQFSQPNPKGHGRVISRFTVVSNASKNRHSRKNSEYTDTEVAETLQSYDPFRASHTQNFIATKEVSHANVVVYRGRSAARELHSRSGSSRGSATLSNRSHSRQKTLVPPRAFASRSSIASSTLSRGSGRGLRVPLKHKRGVGFSHARKRSEISQKNVEGQTPQSFKLQSPNRKLNDSVSVANATIVSPTAGTRYARSNKIAAFSPASRPTQKQDRSSRLWQEDFRQLSTSLAKTCDEAFNRKSVVSSIPTKVSGLEESNSESFESPISSFNQTIIHHGSPSVSPLQPKLTKPSLGNRTSWDARPLPPPPNRSESVKRELAEARQMVQLRKLSGNDSPGYLDRLATHIDQLMQPPLSPLHQKTDKRIVSAPVTSKHHEAGQQLPSIHESNREDTSSNRSSDYEKFVKCKRVNVATSSRVTSAPRPRFNLDDRAPKQDDLTSGAIRAIQTSYPSPAKPPAPLNIRKKCSAGPPLIKGGNQSIDSTEFPPKFDLRQQYARGSRADTTPNYLDINMQDYRMDDASAKISTLGPAKKKPNWFKRSSKPEEGEGFGFTIDQNETADGSKTSAKRKILGFGALFGRRSLRQEKGVRVAGFDIQDDNASVMESATKEQPYYVGREAGIEKPSSRQIEPQQNWLARLFHVKPATKHICFSVSKRRARQEIVNLLKEWRKYGAKDIVVDKERTIVFGRVGPKNYFKMKEAAFACEILTVIEHGKRSHLSIARFTQEKGAASSFYKVVETVETVLKSRGMLVSDERKKRMIIKTLNGP